MPDATADPGEPQLAALALATDRVDRASECFGDFLLCQKLREREDARLGLKCCVAGHSIVLRLLSVHHGVRRCGSALTETPLVALDIQAALCSLPRPREVLLRGFRTV